MSITQYFPNYLSFIYDPTVDNQYPYPFDPNYWPKIFIYYFKELKYKIITFFRPWEVQLALYLLPQEPIIRAKDLAWIYLGLLILVLVALISCYQKCLFGQKAAQGSGE